jgi:hypothetical protein
MIEQDLNKAGTNWFSVSIQRGMLLGDMRNSVGLIVHMHADPRIEQFMQMNQPEHEQKLLVTAYANAWVSLDPANPLEVYTIPDHFLDNDRSYRLDLPGSPLLPVNYEPYHEGKVLTNLSFLRLVGISNPQGLKFGITGAYSKPYIKKLAGLLISETKIFLENYITPVNINFRITSQS